MQAKCANSAQLSRTKITAIILIIIIIIIIIIIKIIIKIIIITFV